MTDLLPCPFCGAPAEKLELTDEPNIGGSCISCTHCQASSAVEFEFKETLIERWNRRQRTGRDLAIEEKLRAIVSEHQHGFDMARLGFELQDAARLIATLDASEES